ncbi:MAG: hypothetical protein M1358_03980 [Chloroflexi bacterium]|nr:hypothetical protein [Chloroflexota bacterium]
MLETLFQWIFGGLSFLCCTLPGWIILGFFFLVWLVARRRGPIGYRSAPPFDPYDDYGPEDDAVPYFMNNDMMDHGHITRDWFDGGHHHH